MSREPARNKGTSESGAGSAEHLAIGHPNLMRRLGNLEVTGELLFLMIVGAFFGLMLIQSLDWRLSAAIMPRIVIGVGSFVWLIRAAILTRYLISGSGSDFSGVRWEGSSKQIMDLGFYVAEGAVRRGLIATGSIVGLMLAVWLVGWHTAVPVFMLVYLRVLGKVAWRVAVGGALFLLAIILGLYDAIFDTVWNEPFLFRMARSIFG